MSTSRIALLAAALLLAGCTRPGVRGLTCDTDADCGPGQTCSHEVCVGGSSSSSSSGSSGSVGSTGSSGSSTSSSGSGSSTSSSGGSSSSGSSGSTASSGSSGSTSSSGSSGSSGGQGCSAGCPTPGDYCDPQRNACTPAYALAFTVPASGDWVDGGGGAVEVTAIVAVGSGYPQPDRVVLSQGVGACSNSAGDLALDGGSWSGHWTPAPAADGPQQLCADAFWPDGGLVASTSVTANVDVTPPVLAPSLSRLPDDTSDPGLSPAFARDGDPLTVAAGASDDGGSGVGQVAYALVYLDGGAAPGLSGAVLSLQQPDLGEHGTVRVHVTAWDRVLNSASVDVDVPITRWKWVADTQTGAPLLLPASPPGGRIYVAAATSGADNVFAFEPDGGKAWSAAVADVPSLPPALGRLHRDALFVAQAATGKLSVVDLAGNPFTKNVDSSVNALATVDSATDAGTATDAAVLTSSAKETLWMVEEDGSAPPISADFTPVASTASARGLFTDSSNIWFGATESSVVTGYALRSVPATTSAPGFGSLQAHIALAEPITVGPVASGQEAYFGSNTSTKVRLGRVDFTAGSETPTAAVLGSAVAAEPVMDGSGNAYVATASTLTQYSPSLGAVSGPSGVAADRGMLLTAGHLYALSGQALTDVALSAGGGAFGSSTWSIALTGLGGASGAPGLLCGPHGTSAVLVPTAQGKLAAFVIDEAGLDPSAPWPKARRDLLNSANIQTRSPCP